MSVRPSSLQNLRVNSTPAWKRKRAEAMREAGATRKEIAAELQISWKTMIKWWGQLTPEERGRLSKSIKKAEAARRARAEERYRMMVELRRQGFRNPEIAERVGVNANTVYRNIGPTPKRLGGWRRHDVAMHERVRFLRELDYTIQEISDKTGIPTSTISDWLQRGGC